MQIIVGVTAACHIFTEIISAYGGTAEGQQRFWLMVLLCRCLNYDAVTYSVELFSCSHEIVVLQHRPLTMLFRRLRVAVNSHCAVWLRPRHSTWRADARGAVIDTGHDWPTWWPPEEPCVAGDFKSNHQRQFFTALHATQTRSSDEKAVRPSVCPSVKRVDCDKTVERSILIFIPYERSFSLVFWKEKWLVGGDPFYLKFWVNQPPLEQNRRFSTNNRS